MIEWDEILEDVDWKRGAAFLIVGLILIGGAVFLGLDMHKANTARTLLLNDEKDIAGFKEAWAAPKGESIADLQKQLDAVNAQYAATGVVLSNTIDQDAITAKVRGLANSDGVQIAKITTSISSDGYCSILQLTLVFSASRQGNALDFLTDLSRMTEPHAVKSQPVSLLTGTMDVTVEFYGFDISDWNEINNCELKVNIPTIPNRDISGIYVFGKGLEDLKAKVEQEKAGMNGIKNQFNKGCELQNDVDMVKNKIKIINEKLKK